MEQLIARLQALLVEGLNLEDIVPSEIDPDTPLFGDGPLGLDSVDALEIVMEVERTFGVTIEDDADSREILATVRTLAAHIQACSE